MHDFLDFLIAQRMLSESYEGIDLYMYQLCGRGDLVFPSSKERGMQRYTRILYTVIYFIFYFKYAFLGNGTLRKKKV